MSYTTLKELAKLLIEVNKKIVEFQKSIRKLEEEIAIEIIKAK